MRERRKGMAYKEVDKWNAKLVEAMKGCDRLKSQYDEIATDLIYKLREEQTGTRTAALPCFCVWLNVNEEAEKSVGNCPQAANISKTIPFPALKSTSSRTI